MPTNRRRHWVTETPPVQEALDELRAELGTDRVLIAEIVVLGARAMLADMRAEEERRAAARRRLADRIRNKEPLGDRAAAEEARRSWARY
jgi:hypothetical protein